MPPAFHLHLVNPTLSQLDLFGYIAKKLAVPLAYYPEWTPKLKAASATVENAQEHLTLRSPKFYGLLNQGSESKGSRLLPCSTEVTRGVSLVLGGEGLGENRVEEIQRRLDYWKYFSLLKF